MKLPLQIALGILLAAGIAIAFRLLLVGHAVRTIDHQVAEMQSQQQTAMEAFQDQQRRKAAARKQHELQARATAAEQLRREYAAAIEQQAAEHRKAAAWDNFYHPEKRCEAPGTNDELVACGNAHIRARREFERRWAAGEL